MQKEGNKIYLKLLISLLLSFIIMYGVMFFNVNELNHIYLSYSRLYMTLLMVSPMAIIMLIVMKHMYGNKKLNYLIINLFK